MADFHGNQNAARLSEDIGDVLSAIRRLIAADEGADRSISPQPAVESDLPDPITDPAEQLARRYGGEASLARRLVEAGTLGEQADRRDGPLDHDDLLSEPWPFGASANGPAAERDDQTSLGSQEHGNAETPILRHRSTHDTTDDAHEAGRNVRHAPRIVRMSRGALETVRTEDDRPPLKLEEASRVIDDRAGDSPDTSEWHSFIRARRAGCAENQGSNVVSLADQLPSAGNAPAVNIPAATTDEDEASFAEAFDWKANLTAEQPVEAVSRTEAPKVAQPEGEQATFSGIAMQSDDEIRALLRDMIQEEMHGELGQRFSRNLRAVIRREVAAAIDEQLDRL
ncbi:hypothetical protein PAF17_00800 [Paracoccus sp. Z330]|uniref:DUF2497 domain-containing protein n=1 Tax=Paracoccus onchidii TaxID=3017813 RepID=A0ABT4Z9M0_9RHOB|nr:hypothetical protein [Paracoccus onchidii]MDB6176043.1 hypothetical protein [Paracoccus onchidii]